MRKGEYETSALGPSEVLIAGESVRVMRRVWGKGKVLLSSGLAGMKQRPF